MPERAALPAEDAKLVTLARATRARTGASEGAAVRDDTGRTYAGATVVLPSLAVTALEAAVLAAVSSGASGLEAAAVVTSAPTAAPPPVLADLGCATYVVAGLDGTVTSVADLAGR